MVPHIYIIDGNIGCGKSTLLRNISNRYKNDCSVVVLVEPIHIWKQFHGEDLLEACLSSTASSSDILRLQLCILKTRMEQLTREFDSDVKVIFVERSIITDHLCFTLNHKLSGRMSMADYSIYEYMWGQCVQQFHKMLKFVGEILMEYPPNIHILYLKCDPSVCLQRMKIRGRPQERTVSKDYIEKLNELYDDHFNHLSNLVKCKLLIEVSLAIVDTGEHSALELFERVKFFYEI
jgi:deoxyadenosine/deoxycytidine kinase